MKKRGFMIVRILVVAFALNLLGCASSGGTLGEQSEVYSQSFEEMVGIVEQAVKAGSLNIEHAYKSNDETKLTMIVTKNAYFEGAAVQKARGEVVITKLENGKVRVVVRNPEYHFTVPRYQREKYNRIIFSRISEILKKENV